MEQIIHSEMEISDIELERPKLNKRALQHDKSFDLRYCRSAIHDDEFPISLSWESLRTCKLMPSSLVMLSYVIILSFCLTCAQGQNEYGSFNATSLIIPNSNWHILKTKQVTFRTCTDSGSLLYIRESQASSSPTSSLPTSSSSIQELNLSLHNTSVYFTWSTTEESNFVHLGNTVNDNKWYTVRLKYLLGSLDLELQAELNSPPIKVTVANSTYNSLLLDVRLSGALVIGENFSGCIYQGPGVNFNSPGILPQNVVWNTCPLQAMVGCGDVDDCWRNPCRNGATCIDLTNSFYCKCPPNFNGSICENDLARMYGCTIQPCLNGGTCVTQAQLTVNARQYECQCREGYTGVNCEIRLDMCRTKPCQTGLCISGENRYTCDCSGTGFNGVNCTDDVNECDNATVCAPYTCSNYPGGFACNCPSGYDGIPCKDINECSSSPCSNGGTCVNGADSYTCSCPAGFSGLRCETDIDDCEGAPCTAVNTRCVDGIDAFKCLCLDGFTGTPCANIDECQKGVCQNNASCTDNAGGYDCGCLLGYTGQNCETDIDECQSVLCQNNATCENQINNFHCACLPGFRGNLCEENINDCQDHRCRNGAVCKDMIQKYQCECVAGWESQFCEVDTNDCSPDPCENKGTCTDRLNGFNCSCPSGFTGPTCKGNINECSPNPCLNQGDCFDGIADYACNCTLDWMGKNCSDVYDECALKPCLNGGNCTAVPRMHNHTCDCVDGFRGKNCEENIDDCIDNNCSSFQVCYDGIATFTCGCPIGYSGAVCDQEIKECENDPCQNNGTCIDGTGEYSCTCKHSYINITKSIGRKGVFLTGYNGTNCEHDIDECQYSDPPICQNEAKCENNPPGSFTCYCKSVSDDGKLNTGKLCEAQKTYCDIASEPCANGGTCIELPQSSKCRCAPGYTGQYCKTDINECEPNPCQSNGNCTDKVNDYSCDCVLGFAGRNCEENIDDCSLDPCMNGGQCKDGVNSFSCNCTDTGFSGDKCQTNIDNCVGHQCQHGSTCVDGIKSYTCACLTAYDGEFCEIDVPECAAWPCQYNSTCLEKSNQTLYGKGDDRFQIFTFQAAAGYVCDCVDGVKGVNCSEQIDECIPDPCQNGAQCIDKFNAYFCSCPPGYEGNTCANEINECVTLDPCKNGATCEDRLADYECTCSPVNPSVRNYDGKNCTTYLSGCDGNNPCLHGQCFPVLISETPTVAHSYQCRCIPGYTGVNCNRPTVISFSNGTYISQKAEGTQFELSLRFRTTLSNALIFLCKFSHDQYVAVTLDGGRISVKYQHFQRKEWNLVTKNPLNDANFHALKVFLTHNITVVLPDNSCPGQGSDRCEVMESYQTKYTNAHLYVGSIQEGDVSAKVGVDANFVGCMDDVIFNNTYFIPGQQYGEIIGVKAPGCTRKEQCLENSCNGHGACEDLWDTFKCICDRPFYGQFCDKDYTPMTFGQIPESYANYAMPPGIVVDNIKLSFFLTTRQKNGFILYAGNRQLDNTGRLTFISFKITDGFLCGDFVKCQQLLQFNTSVFIADGTQHRIEFSVAPTSLEVKVDMSPAYDAKDVRPSSEVCDTRFGFYVSNVYLGQIPQVVSRRRRSAAATFAYFRSRRAAGVSPSGKTVFEDNKSLDPFEGVLQDVRVDSVKLGVAGNNTDIVAPSESNFTVGAESTRFVCSEDDPCMNGGNCTNEYFNDFRCDCKRGYRGKNCSEPDFCSYGSCPEQSVCVNLQDGYECVSAAQFYGTNYLTYKLSGERPTTSIVTIEFRTRILFGAVFYIGSGDYYFKLRVAEGKLELAHKLTPEFSQNIHTRDGRLVNDGKWYQAHFEIVNVTQVRLQIHLDGKVVDESDLVTVDTTYATFESMLAAGEYLTLGAARYPYPMINREVSFIGCLNQSRIGGVLLPYFRDSLFENNTAAVKFVVEDEQRPTIGCQSPDACTATVCLNGGTCEDLWYAHRCECHVDFSGPRCEEKIINNCARRPCLNKGNCVDGVGSFTCDCATGFTGDTCQTDLAFCNATTEALCLNGAACVEETNGFSCNCSSGSGGSGSITQQQPNFTGIYCDVSTQQPCSTDVCKNGGTCTTTSTNVTNGSNNETVQSFSCACVDPYESPLCEKKKNYCDMQPPPCQNGGTCTESDSSPFYTCDCSVTSDFEGLTCTDQIADCGSANCNNGTCIDGNRTHVCECNAGYTGNDCSTQQDRCGEGICQRGQCENNICNCTGTYYDGQYCQNEVNECVLGVCVHSENCTNLEGDFTCNCSMGFEGKRCDQPFCSNELCQNEASCSTNATDWICQCKEFYAGKRCQIKGPCADKPCNATNSQLSQTCSQTLEPTEEYTCNCRNGWNGKNCDDNIDECTLNTHGCVNGNCVDLPGSFKCDCTPGYTGPKCSVDIDECQGDPCKNGGRCTDGINEHICNCTGTGYEGKDCEIEINECLGSDRVCNHGNCTNTPGDYKCECGEKYLGHKCEFDNPCVNQTCSTNGQCIHSNFTQAKLTFMCQCNNNYEGPLCEKLTDDDEPNLALIIGPIVGGLVFIVLLILLITFVMTARSKRATRGAYSPSQQETSGSRVELGNVLKKPPEERLI